MPGPDHVSVIEYNLNTDPPVADFEASQTIIQVNENVDFTDLSTNNPNSWEWIFESGTPETSDEQNPSILYETVGTFDVSLTATNDYGFDTKLMEDYITVEIIDFIDTENAIIQLSVYPNPSQGNISILLQEKPNEEMNYAIFDMNGRMLIRGALQLKENNIDLKHIDSGIYFLKVSTAKNSRILKISKR
jgi:PKD repeat protein